MLKEPIEIVIPADPKYSSAEKLIDVFNLIVCSETDDLVVNASNVYWVSPFTACWIAALKDKCDTLGKKIQIIDPIRDNAIHQWKNLGIKKYLGFTKESEPLSRQPAVEVTKLKEPSYPFAGKILRILSDALNPVENFNKALHFAIRETIENCFEHDETDHCYVCA